METVIEEKEISKEEKLLKTVAKNLTAFRKAAGFTQLELAEKINYSDRSVSKWERGDGMPDVVVLKTLAELYDTSVDMLLSENIKINIVPPSIKRQRKLRLIISLFVMGGVWFVAAAVYVWAVIFTSSPADFWLSFIYAIPVSAFVMYIFNTIWGNKLLNSIFISAIGWSLALSIYLSLLNVPFIWLMFPLAAAFQIMMFIWFFLNKTRFSIKWKKTKIK